MQFTAYATPTQQLCAGYMQWELLYTVVWVLCYRFMDNKSYVDHWDDTDQSL